MGCLYLFIFSPTAPTFGNVYIYEVLIKIPHDSNYLFLILHIGLLELFQTSGYTKFL